MGVTRMRVGPLLGAAAGLGAIGVGIAIALNHGDDDHAAPATGDGTVTIQPGGGTLGSGPTPDATVLDPVEIEHPEYLRAETLYATHDVRETTVQRFADDLFRRYDHNDNGKIEIGDNVAGLQQDERVTGHEDAYYSL